MHKKLTLFTLVLLVISNCLLSQGKKGINFDDKLSWDTIKEKAKRENKYIFVDCFATWCGPCKMMDENVYSNAELGEEFDKNFISIKLQMDKNPADNEYTRSWYSIAENFQKEYHLVGYPSLLFFSPKGNLVHRGVGYKSKEALIALSRDAVNPNTQYVGLKKNYKVGKIAKSKDVNALIDIAIENGDKEFAEEVAVKYKKDFIDKLSMDQLCTIDNLIFIKKHSNLVNSQDLVFSLFRNSPSRCDSLLPGLAKAVINLVVEKEEITPRLNYKDPRLTNWQLIGSNINRKYGKDIAEKLVPNARMNFAFETKNWKEYANLKDRELLNNDFPVNDSSLYAWNLNIAAWNTYLVCDDSTVLAKALSWSDRSMQILSAMKADSAEQYLDTKARILYKLGHISKALENEQKAIEVGMRKAQKSGGGKSIFYNEFSAVLEKMKNGESISN
ncbi:thioredoxin family protein [Chitinophaga sancti]|uniref:Thioredoxin family protein n=1 Tax=Chitinophaga sancti TaxID=1004 RepID=A0A1K1T372_9BACT|nr:thioredoxin family protein [Chitinophaga sancti]WQD59601.1 thioredoxin family protein [Chitinophaga sancti]WQG88266.1 thioredoxin family protein [Chitinophaga sancti]SFW91026.1 Thioredoxin-like [Chitinophaga sancti]